MSELLMSDGAITADCGEPVRAAVRPPAPAVWGSHGLNLPLAGAVLLHLALLALAMTTQRWRDSPPRLAAAYQIRLYSPAEVTPTAGDARATFVTVPSRHVQTAPPSLLEVGAATAQPPVPAQEVAPLVAGPAVAPDVPAPVESNVAVTSLMSGGNSGPAVTSGPANSLPVEPVVGRGADSSMASGAVGTVTVTPVVPSLLLAHPLYRENPEPEYPLSARHRGLEGTVVLEAQVTSAGAVGSLAIHQSSGHSLLDEAALKAVKSWRFEPGRRGGEAVAMAVLVPVRFGLR